MHRATPHLDRPSDGLAIESTATVSRTPWFVRERLEARHFALLSAIGEEGNLRQAAEQLNIPQLAVSRLLGDVEDIVGAQLFDRFPQGIRANWYGTTVVRQARIALAHLSDTADDTALLNGTAEYLNIGAVSGPAMSFVPRAIAQVARQYPLVRLRLQVESSDRLLQELQAKRIEVMVGRLVEPYATSQYNYKPLSDEPVCVVARRAHPLSLRKQVRMHDLSAAPWIVPQAGSVLRYQFDSMFREAGFSPPRRIIEAVSQMVVTRLLEETDYLGILSREVAAYYASLGALSIVPVALRWNLDSFGIVTHAGATLSPVANALCRALESAAAKTSTVGRRSTHGKKRR